MYKPNKLTKMYKPNKLKTKCTNLKNLQKNVNGRL